MKQKRKQKLRNFDHSLRCPIIVLLPQVLVSSFVPTADNLGRGLAIT